jgi:hypothetical protein
VVSLVGGRAGGGESAPAPEPAAVPAQGGR